jgi:hypothetical protein
MRHSLVQFILPMAIAVSALSASSRQALSQHANGPDDCDPGHLKYVDDTQKIVTATGALASLVDNSPVNWDADDGDLKFSFTPTPASERFLSDPSGAVKTERLTNLHTEIALILKDNYRNYDDSSDIGPFGRLLRSLLAVDMNVIARGDWVIDHHPGETPWTELHPMQYLRASTQRDPATASNIVFLFAQDWNNCRSFYSSSVANSELLTLAIPRNRDEVPLEYSSGNWVESKVGYIREQSVLDGSSGSVRSGYETTHRGFPNAPELRVGLTLYPPIPESPHPYLPAYLAQFDTGSVVGFADRTIYQVVPRDSGKKGIHVMISGKLTGASGSQHLVKATWILHDGFLGSPYESSDSANPVNQVYNFDRWYSPSEGKNISDWTLAVTATDWVEGTFPNAASASAPNDGWGWTRTFVNMERVYSVTPSHVEIRRTDFPKGHALPRCDVDIVIPLKANTVLPPQINLTSKLSWSVGEKPAAGAKAKKGLAELRAAHVGVPDLKP